MGIPDILEGVGHDAHLKGQSEQALNQLATHLPDAVIELDHQQTNPFLKRIQGVLMFTDISGFTSLCERYGLNTRNGTDQLTKTLNAYMGALVEGIISSDGDILKYAGDAILAVWKVNRSFDLPKTIVRAVKCALYMQAHCGEWQTDVGVKLKVKIAIAAGNMQIIYIGNNEYRHYVTTGRTVDEVNKAEKFCESGDIVVTPNAWALGKAQDILHEACSDGRHIKVRAMTFVKSHYNIARTISYSTAQAELEKEGLKKKDVVKELAKYGDEKTNSFWSSEYDTSVIDIRYRTTVFMVKNHNVDDRLKLYIAKPVLRKIENNQPLAYLSEMRQVTIAFINMSMVVKSDDEQCQCVQDAFSIIYRHCKQLRGCMNKTFMFDKGSTFLVIFGLPGYKNEQDCAHALQASYRMKSDLAKIPQIEYTSIGVTTGQTFCGVVGHPHRHEYTVIGRKVNMAARLMMHYPDKVTCDNETFHHSKLPKTFFSNQPAKEMKGLKNPGVIREFTEVSGGIAQSATVQQFDYPLLGRDAEMNMFLVELQRIKGNEKASSERRVICIKGEAGIGKSRLLDAVITSAQEMDHRVISCAVTIHDEETPYFVVKTLLVNLLELRLDTPHQERSHALLTRFENNPLIVDNLFLLNDLLLVKFPQNEKFQHADLRQREKALHSILNRIVHDVMRASSFVIFAIDDAQNIDHESWGFLSDLGHDSKALVVITLRDHSMKKSGVFSSAAQVLEHPDTFHIKVGGLPGECLAALACQILNVVQIPKELETILIQKSHGIPSWCETLLHELYTEGKIELVPYVRGHEKETSQQQQQADSRQASSLTTKVNPNLITRSRRPSVLSNTPTMLGKSTTTVAAEMAPPLPGAVIIDHEEEPETKKELAPEEMMCILAPGISVSTIQVPDSMKGMMLSRIDSMPEADQMLIKCASVLGTSFTRKVLEAIMPKSHSASIRPTLKRLVESGVLECAFGAISGNESFNHRQKVNKHECHCPHMEGEDHSLLDCQFLRFHNNLMQETAYSMFIDTNRKELHIAAANHLENQAHRCLSCGGGEFMAHHSNLMQGQMQTTLEKQRAPPETKQRQKRGAITKRKQKVSTMFRQARGSVEDEPKTLDMEADIEALDLSKKKRQSIFAKKANESYPKEATLEKKPRRQLRKSSFSDAEKLLEECAPDEEMVVDKRNCECMQILASVYPQLVRHWRMGEDLLKTIHFLTEAGAAAAANNNNIQALSYLYEANHIHKELKKRRNALTTEALTDEEESLVVEKAELARIESLTGEALWHMGQVNESLPHFKKALKILGNAQPGNKVSAAFKIIPEFFQQMFHLLSPERFLGRASSHQANKLIEQARCLSHMFHEYYEAHKDLLAVVTALQQLNRAEKADDDFHELIMAYTCMLECCQLENWPNLGKCYEQVAMDRVKEVEGSMAIEDMTVVANMFVVSLTFRLSQGKVADAVEAGYAADALLEKLHDSDMEIQMLPVLAQALLLVNNVPNCVDMLKQLEYITDELDDVISKASYYGCCMDLLLEEGLQLESFQSCLTFAEGNLSDPSFQLAPLYKFYLAASLALWYARKGNWDASNHWQVIAHDCEGRMESYIAIHGFIKIIECRLLTICHGTNTGRGAVVREHNILVRSSFKHLSQLCKKYRVFRPRMLHLQAYHLILNGAIRKARNKLQMSLSASTGIGAVLEEQWAEHSQRAWFGGNAGAGQEKAKDLWIINSDSDMVDWHASQESGVTASVRFTLPVPCAQVL